MPDIALQAALAALAFVFRLVYLLQLRTTPLFHSPGMDSINYIEWAKAIAAGDWIGSEVFFLGPLYPYVLAVLRLAAGPDAFHLLLAQSALGSLGPVLLYRLGMRLFDRPTAIAAALGMATYGMLIQYDNQFLMEWLLTLLLLAILLLLAGVRRESGRVRPGAAGFLLGAAALGRGSLLLLAPAALLWLWWGGSRHRRHSIVAFIAGLALAIFPVTLRNAVVGGDRVLITSNGGLNLFIGNNPIGRGTYIPLDQVAKAARVNVPVDVSWVITDLSGKKVAEAAVGHPLKPSEVSAFYSGRALDYMRQQPGRALRIFGRKLLLFWNRAEIAQIEDPALYRELVPMLRWPLLGFTVVGPLSLLGLGLLAMPGTLAGRRSALPLLGSFVAAFTLSVVLFFVTARYRAPAIPMLILLAAFAAVELGRRLRRGLRRGPQALVRSLGLPLLALAGFTVIENLDLVRIDRAAALINLGIALAGEGRQEEAIAAFERAVAAEPGDPVSCYNLGAAYLMAGRAAEAAVTFERAVGIAPRSAAGWSGLGESQLRMGRPEEAVAAFRQEASLAPAEAAPWLRIAAAEHAAGRPDSARSALQEARRRAAGNPEISLLIDNIERAIDSTGTMR